MDNNELKDIIEKARIARGLSQRELSKQIGLSQSTYNDTINGKMYIRWIKMGKSFVQCVGISYTKKPMAERLPSVFGRGWGVRVCEAGWLKDPANRRRCRWQSTTQGPVWRDRRGR